MTHQMSVGFSRSFLVFLKCGLCACGHRNYLGLHFSFGLKWRMGRFGLSQMLKSGFGLGWRHLRAGSSRVGYRPYSITITKFGLDPV